MSFLFGNLNNKDNYKSNSGNTRSLGMGMFSSNTIASDSSVIQDSLIVGSDYLRNPYVFTAIKYIADKISDKKIQIKIDGKNNNSKSLNKLLNIKPNDIMNRHSFIFTIVSNIAIHGECFVEIVRDKETSEPIKLLPLMHDRVTIYVNDANDVSEIAYTYEYENREIQNDNLLHLKVFSDETITPRAYSMLFPLRDSIIKLNNISEGLNNLIESHKKITRILKLNTESKLSKTKRKELADEYKLNISDSDGSEILLILDKNADILDKEIKTKSNELLAVKKDVVSQLASVFQISVEVFKNELVNTSSEVENEKADDAIKPFVNAICSELSCKLLLVDNIVEFKFKNDVEINESDLTVEEIIEMNNHFISLYKEGLLEKEQVVKKIIEM